MQQSDKYYCLMPFSTLLENICGIYLPLISGAKTVIICGSDRGLSGSTTTHTKRLFDYLKNFSITTIVITPQVLKNLIDFMDENSLTLPKAKYIAVGGAKTSIEFLQRANHLRLPVYQGYGLTESASVISLNYLCRNKIGSVDRLLPHSRSGSVLMERY